MLYPQSNLQGGWSWNCSNISWNQVTSHICYSMELAWYCVHKLKIYSRLRSWLGSLYVPTSSQTVDNNLSLFWIAHLIALDLRYYLNTQVHTKVKPTTGYIIKIRCWKCSLSCAVIRICLSTSPYLSWLLGRCDIAWIGDSVAFSHVRVVKTVRLSKVIASRVVTMSPMSLVTHCAETKQTNLGLISKVGLLPQTHYGFSIGLNHLHTDQYFNVLGHVVFMTQNY